MENFKSYINGQNDSADLTELDSIIGKWEWFITPRIVRSILTGKNDPRLTLHELFHVSKGSDIDHEEVKLAYKESIIDKFLNADSYKINTESDARDIDEPEAFGDDTDDEFLTEELAEVYVKQGLFEQALKIYRRLSLLYPKKSIYFAEIIERISNENKQLK